MKIDNFKKDYFKDYDLYIFGFGKSGKIITDSLIKKKIKIKAIVDNFVQKKKYKQIPIVKEDNLSYQRKAICFISFYNHYINLYDTQLRLSKLFYKTYNIFQFKNFINYKKLGYFIKPQKFLKNNQSKLMYLLNKLADQKSINTLLRVNKFRETGNLKYYPKVDKNIYLIKKKFSFEKKVNIADLGAFDGLFAKKIYKIYKTKISKLVLFEPDKFSFQKLKSEKFFNKTIFTILNSPVSNKKKKIFFKHSGINSSHIKINDKKKNINTISLDSYLKTKFDIIKMDVEGEELNVLKGMKRNIISKSPYIFISIYHRWDDLFKIPQYLDHLKTNYKYYLRCHEHSTFGTVLYCLPNKK